VKLELIRNRSLLSIQPIRRGKLRWLSVSRRSDRGGFGHVREQSVCELFWERFADRSATSAVDDLVIRFFWKSGRITGNVTSVVIKPQLRVGEPSDTFTVRAPNTRDHQDRAGDRGMVLRSTCRRCRHQGSDSSWSTLSPPVRSSPAIQWRFRPRALQTLGKTAIDTGTGVGELMLVPKHGILHIGENASASRSARYATRRTSPVMPMDVF